MPGSSSWVSCYGRVFLSGVLYVVFLETGINPCLLFFFAFLSGLIFNPRSMVKDINVSGVKVDPVVLHNIICVYTLRYSPLINVRLYVFSLGLTFFDVFRDVSVLCSLLIFLLKKIYVVVFNWLNLMLPFFHRCHLQ